MNGDLISRKAFIDFLYCGHLVAPEKVFFSESDVLSLIKSRPAVDAVEVVRCEDCIHRSRYADSRGHYICNHPGMSPDGVNIWVTGDHFCGEGTTQMPELTEEDEVVRCRDCKHFKRTLENDTYCQTVNGMTDPEEDDYCSYGERRSDHD